MQFAPTELYLPALTVFVKIRARLLLMRYWLIESPTLESLLSLFSSWHASLLASSKIAEALVGLPGADIVGF